MEEEKEPIEKITLLDVLTDLGLQDEVEYAVGATDFTLRPSSIFACVNNEANLCVSHYNKVREGAVQSQKANLQLLDKWLRDHITRHGSGMAIPQDKAELLLSLLIRIDPRYPMLPSPRAMDVDGAETQSVEETLARKKEIEKIRRVRMETFKMRLVSHRIPWDAGPTKCWFDFLLGQKDDDVALEVRNERFRALRAASKKRTEAYHPPATSEQWIVMKNIFEIRHEEGNFSCFLHKPDFSNPKVPPKAVVFGPNFVFVPPGRFCSKIDQCASNGRFAIFCRPGLWIDTAAMPQEYTGFCCFVDWDSPSNRAAQDTQNATFTLEIFEGEAIFVCNRWQHKPRKPSGGSYGGGVGSGFDEDMTQDMSVGGGGGRSGSSSTSSSTSTSTSTSSSSACASSSSSAIKFFQPGYDQPITFAKSAAFLEHESISRNRETEGIIATDPITGAPKKRNAAAISGTGEEGLPSPQAEQPPGVRLSLRVHDAADAAAYAAAAGSVASASGASASDENEKEEDEEEDSANGSKEASSSTPAKRATENRGPKTRHTRGNAKGSGGAAEAAAEEGLPSPPAEQLPGVRFSLRVRDAAAAAYASADEKKQELKELEEERKEVDEDCDAKEGAFFSSFSSAKSATEKSGTKTKKSRGNAEEVGGGAAAAAAATRQPQPSNLVLPGINGIHEKDLPQYYQEHLAKKSWVAFRLTPDVKTKIEAILARAQKRGVNIRGQVLEAGIAMSSALQPGNAKRTMLSESIFDAVPCQLYLAEICSLLVPCVSEALSLVNPDARYAHTMTMFVAICQLAEQPGVQTVEAQKKHTDVKKECFVGKDKHPNAKNISVLITIDPAEFSIWPGSHLLKQFYCSLPGVLDSISESNMKFEELTLKLPAYSIILFFGSAVHKGGRALPTPSGYQLRFFQYCDPNTNYSKDKSPSNHTYVDGVDPFFKSTNRFLNDSDKRQDSC